MYMAAFPDEVNTIKDYLLKVSESNDVKDQICYSTELFKYIQTIPTFIAVNPSFRRAVINKLNEFENNHNVIKDKKMLTEIKKTREFLEDLRYLDNYKLDACETPVKKINIII